MQTTSQAAGEIDGEAGVGLAVDEQHGVEPGAFEPESLSSGSGAELY